MIEILTNYGLFLAKTVTILVACFILLAALLSLLFKGRTIKKDSVQVISLNERFKNFTDAIEQQTLSKSARKRRTKEIKAKKKREKRGRKKDEERKNRLFVLDFNGDIRASAVDALKEEVTAVLTAVGPGDEVLIRVDSSGGMVHTYGLAASQLARFRKRDIFLTVAVDKVAASGGYLMASVANRIIAAPFAIIGSIGVIAQLPNFHKFLKKYDIDYEQVTAGEYKRTLTMFGKNSEEGRKKLREELEETHQLFKEFVTQGRKELNIDQIATGEYWYGTRALELNLVDELITSDDYLLGKSESMDLFSVKFEIKKSLSERLPFVLQRAVKSLFHQKQTVDFT